MTDPQFTPFDATPDFAVVRRGFDRIEVRAYLTELTEARQALDARTDAAGETTDHQAEADALVADARARAEAALADARDEVGQAATEDAALATWLADRPSVDSPRSLPPQAWADRIVSSARHDAAALVGKAESARRPAADAAKAQSESPVVTAAEVQAKAMRDAARERAETLLAAAQEHSAKVRAAAEAQATEERDAADRWSEAKVAAADADHQRAADTHVEARGRHQALLSDATQGASRAQARGRSQAHDLAVAELARARHELDRLQREEAAVITRLRDLHGHLARTEGLDLPAAAVASAAPTAPTGSATTPVDQAE